MIAFLIALSLITGSTVAWMAMNRDVKSDMDQLELNTSGLKIKNYNVYCYNYETNEIDNAYNHEDQYGLVSFDSIFEERNENTLLIYEVFLYNFDPNTTKFTVYVDRESHDTEWNSTEDDEHFTSNLIYIKAATGGTLEIDATGSVSEIFYGARDAFQSIAQRNQFIHISKSGSDYTLDSSTDRITLPITLSSEERALISGADGRSKLIPVYFIFDYDELLIKGQSIDHFSEIEIIGNATIAFKNDIKSILFEQ